MNEQLIYLLESFARFIEQGFNIQDIAVFIQPIDQIGFVESLNQCMNEGLSIDDALQKCKLPHYFLEYYQFFKLHFSLSETLLKTLKICKKRNEIKRSLVKRLTYPVFMIVFLVIFSIFVLVFLLPQVENLFNEFNIEKSILVKIVFILLKFIPWIVVLTLLCLGSITFFTLFSIKQQRYDYIDFLISHTHVMSKLIKKYYSIKFAIYYNELLENHYDALSIIETLYQQIDDSDIKMIVYELYHHILEGLSIEDVINEFDYFEMEFKHFFSLIVNNQTYDIRLDDYILYSTKQIEIKVNKMIKLFVPLIYGFVSLFVITIYISIVIPMMNVVSTL